MKLCALLVDEITPDDEGGMKFFAPRANSARTATRCVCAMLAGGKRSVKSTDHMKKHQLSSTVEEAGDSAIPLDVSELDIIRTIQTIMRDVQSRYSKAYTSGKPVVRLNLDDVAIALNKIAWQASRANGSLVILPDSSNAWVVTPVDPATLRCAEPDMPRPCFIDKALICGARLVNVFQASLDGMVDVIISVNDEVVPEIQHSMPFREAQSLWAGSNRVSAHVEIRSGKIPKVKGDILISD